MHHYWFLSFNKYTTLMQVVNNRGDCVLGGDKWECSVLSFQFIINLILLKNYSLGYKRKLRKIIGQAEGRLKKNTRP